MVVLFNHRFPLAGLLEFGLAAAVLLLAFFGVVSAHYPALEGQTALNLSAALVFTTVQLAAFLAFGLHRFGDGEPLKTFAGRFSLSLVAGGGLCYLLFAAFPEGSVFQGSLLDAVLIAAAGLIVVRLFLSSGARPDWLTHRVLVIGTGPQASEVEQAIHSLGDPGLEIVGFYPAGPNGLAIPAEKVLPASAHFDALVERLGVKEVIVALSDQRGGMIPLAELLHCRLRGVQVTDLSKFFERVSGEVPISSLKASWLIYGEGFRQGLARRIIKRTFDLCAALVLLALTMPVMLATAIAILMESGRPIIFRQERVGLGGRTFTLLKFRSMRNDAEQDGVPRWATNEDPRITRVGRFIRKTRIDELPQLFNVLKGEMSFVGPRPERPFFVSQLEGQIPFYGARHTVKPGLTGWAQVRYAYGASVDDAVKKLQYDLYYVKNHTLTLDLVVLIRTIRVVLLGEGAR